MTKITPIPAFNDNYLWLIHNDRDAAVVDPGDAAPVKRFLLQHGLRLRYILNTHHHGDHVGGNLDLLADHAVPVFGPANERIPGMTHPLREGQQVRLDALGLTLRVMEVPGHTAGHIAFVGEELLFCGDTLFSSGCGRVFEGTAQQMHRSLTRLAELPSQTRVFCAHEYTASNIRFAKLVEPENPELLAREAEVAQLRSLGKPTLPSTIDGERRWNPFLRCDVAQVRASAQRHSGQPLAGDVAVFTELRTWKNNT